MNATSKIKEQSKKFSTLAKDCFRQAFAKKSEKISLKKRAVYFICGVVGILANMFLLSGRVIAAPPEEKEA